MLKERHRRFQPDRWINQVGPRQRGEHIDCARAAFQAESRKSLSRSACSGSRAAAFRAACRHWRSFLTAGGGCDFLPTYGVWIAGGIHVCDRKLKSRVLYCVAADENLLEKHHYQAELAWRSAVGNLLRRI
jgi:hypothetical protein